MIRTIFNLCKNFKYLLLMTIKIVLENQKTLYKNNMRIQCNQMIHLYSIP